MSKKLKPESDAEQSERFRKDTQRLIDAGELSPTDAERVMDGLIRGRGQGAS